MVEYITSKVKLSPKVMVAKFDYIYSILPSFVRPEPISSCTLLMSTCILSLILWDVKNKVSAYLKWI